MTVFLTLSIANFHCYYTRQFTKPKTVVHCIIHCCL